MLTNILLVALPTLYPLLVVFMLLAVAKWYKAPLPYKKVISGSILLATIFIILSVASSPLVRPTTTIVDKSVEVEQEKRIRDTQVIEPLVLVDKTLRETEEKPADNELFDSIKLK